jgi:two-component system cell cycle response regulator
MNLNDQDEESFAERLIKISTIGLEQKDIFVIKSMLKLAARLKDRFIIIDNDLFQSADVLFVNADSAESLHIWHMLKLQHKPVIPIMVSQQDKSIENEVSIRRPIIISRVILALENVIQQQLKLDSHFGVATSAGKKILIVDDSFPVRKYLEQKLPQLHSESLMMDFADSGRAAMEKIKLSAYDIVFLDVVMPGVDGYKVCKWIKSVRPKTRIIMLTSKKSPFDKVRGSMSGCDAYLTKPPPDEKLVKVLND